MPILIISGKSYPIKRVQKDLSPIDPIAWLQAQNVYPKVYWKEKDSNSIRAAVGSLLLFPHIPKIENAEDLDVYLYGGVRFQDNLKNDATWEGFPNTAFWLPELELIQEGNQTQLITYSMKKKDSLTAQLQTETAEIPSFPSPMHRSETPSFELWEKNIGSTLNAIESGILDKLVLARKTTLEFTDPVSPWPILRALKEKAVHTTLFAYQISPHLCFLGSTPEKLFQREKDQLLTDAVAATRPRGKTEEDDLKLENELLASDKEQREFKIVKDYLETTLHPFAQDLQWEGKDHILKNSHVQHLHNRLKATLKKDVTDTMLLTALHPTPALGGFPRENALKLLRELEPFDRGWYGSAIGIVGQNRTSLYVAIRSALIQQQRLHLFAGTGLVAKSIAKDEWEELEQKILGMTELFYGRRDAK